MPIGILVGILDEIALPHFTCGATAAVNAGMPGKLLLGGKRPLSAFVPHVSRLAASVVFGPPVLGVMIWFLDRFYKPIVCQSAGLGTNEEAGS